MNPHESLSELDAERHAEPAWWAADDTMADDTVADNTVANTARVCEASEFESWLRRNPSARVPVPRPAVYLRVCRRPDTGRIYIGLVRG